MVPLVILRVIRGEEKYTFPTILQDFYNATLLLTMYLNDLGYRLVKITKFVEEAEDNTEYYFSLLYKHGYGDGLELILQEKELEILGARMKITPILQISFINEDGKVEELREEEVQNFFPQDFYIYGNKVLKRNIENLRSLYV